ncbi:FlaG/FlaF family flagellin (archaellin) [Catenulispora sp. GP43]|uniref:right-handed parallel beta-helix repeat-containing protein n=1 Tax=Catenulispora sp. GP43 TaxID=3156263 RepID=UPI0035132F6B
MSDPGLDPTHPGTPTATAVSPAPSGPGGRGPGFRTGLIAGAVVVAAAGTVAWLVFGGGGTASKPGTAVAYPSATLGPVQTGPLGTQPTKSKKGKHESAVPPQAYTPSGAPNQVVPASQLPGAAGPDPTVACPAATVTVHNADELTQALSAAAPGTVIQLADGSYGGRFTGTGAGTAAQPIFVCGGPGAVLDAGGALQDGYVFHLQNASYWRLSGFTVQNGQKGVVLDHTDHSIVQKLAAHSFGDEAVHLREFSVDDLVLDNTIGDTGKLKGKYGEGVYIGSAQSNWCTYTACQPDRSDNNVVRGNVFSQTTAENVDIKEGTTGGAVVGNTFDGSAFTPDGASGWVNAKGNDYLVAGNTGTASRQDGFQTHQILDGWGKDNVFSGNTAVVNGSGYGFHFTPVNGNVWTCDNKVQGAAHGDGNVPCSAAG